VFPPHERVDLVNDHGSAIESLDKSHFDETTLGNLQHLAAVVDIVEQLLADQRADVFQLLRHLWGVLDDVLGQLIVHASRSELLLLES